MDEIYSDEGESKRIMKTAIMLLGRFEVTQVEQVEKDLSLEDKISLFYLLNDDPEETLKVLKNSANKRIITEWCSDVELKKQREWKLRIFESLDLMQNYKALGFLGYNKRDLSEVRTLLNHLVASVEFDVRKALYSTVDTLTVEELGMVIHRMDPGRNYNGLYQPQFIEMFLLDWHISGLITVGSEGLNAFLNVLEDLEFEDAKKVLSKYTGFVEHSKWLEKQDKLEGTEEKLYTGLQPISFKRVYPIIDENRVGLCVIVNMKNYPTSSEHTPRRGSEFDCCRLQDTMTHMKIKPILLEDLCGADIFKSIQNAVRQNFDNSVYSVLFVVIMAHGKKGIIYGIDGVPVDTEEIRETLSNSSLPCLKNKPKVIIFQCCRGDTDYDAKCIQTDGPSETNNVKASMKDYIICWPTIPGFKSYRQPTQGSLYIQTLCDFLLKLYKSVDLVAILFEVHKEFSEERQLLQLESGQCVSMVPELQTSFTSHLYLFKQPSYI